MFPQAAKDCCKAGQCERNNGHQQVKVECKKQPVELAGQVWVQPELSVFAYSDAPQAAGVIAQDLPFAGPYHSPPDLVILHSSFLI